MGFPDLDGGSVVSRRSSHRLSPASSSKHKHSGSKDGDRRDRDRSRTRSGAVTARSFFGLDGGAVVSGGKSHSGSGRHHSSANRSTGSFYEAFDGGAGAGAGDGASSGRSPKSHHRGDGHHHHRDANRSTASFFGLPNVSSRSIFSSFGHAGFGAGAGAGAGAERGGAAGASSSSYYRRSPRSSFLQRTYRKLRRLLRDLIWYAKRHPLKVFMLAIMPLITGGALTALLARFGMRLPPSIERMLGVGARAVSVSGNNIGLVGDAVRMANVAGSGASGAAGAAGAASSAARSALSLDRRRDGSLQWERRRTAERDYFGSGGSGIGSGVGSSVAGTGFYGRRESPITSESNGGGSSGDGWGASLARFFS